MSGITAHSCIQFEPSPAIARSVKFATENRDYRMQSLQSALGIVAIVAIAFTISENRRAVP
jgi:hypothetical protein